VNIILLLWHTILLQLGIGITPTLPIPDSLKAESFYNRHTQPVSFIYDMNIKGYPVTYILGLRDFVVQGTNNDGTYNNNFYKVRVNKSGNIIRFQPY